mgnify:CR=1 FL=1
MLCSLLLWNLSVQELNMRTRYNDIFASFQYDDRTDYDCYLIWNRTLYVDMSITINEHWHRNNCTDHSGWDSLTVQLMFRTLYCNGQWKGKCPLDILWQGFSDLLNHCSTTIYKSHRSNTGWSRIKGKKYFSIVNHFYFETLFFLSPVSYGHWAI